MSRTRRERIQGWLVWAEKYRRAGWMDAAWRCIELAVDLMRPAEEV